MLRKFSIFLLFLCLNLAWAWKENFISGMESNFPQQSEILGRKLSFEEEYRLFEEELDKGVAKRQSNLGKSRQKRYVYLNTESNVDVGFLIVIPITVVLPGMSNLFNVWRRKRSVPTNFANITQEENPLLQSQVNRISSYFDLVHIPETTCQLRTICELAAEPSKYFPLSDIILTRLRDQFLVGGTSNTTSTTSPSLFNLYSKSADDGSFYGTEKCESSYGKTCKYSTDKLLNMDIMKFWNGAQSNLRLKFEDASEFP